MTIKLILTCGGCPEQYDAVLDGKVVGYLRLRHGSFRVDVPECGGETIYEANPEGDGGFEPHERDYYLRFAVDAIQRWLNGGGAIGKPKPPDVEYEIVGQPWQSDTTRDSR